jgi:hypothetical protein
VVHHIDSYTIIRSNFPTLWPTSDKSSDPLQVSISNLGPDNNFLHKRLRPDVPGYAGTRLPPEELNRSAVVNPTISPVPSS